MSDPGETRDRVREDPAAVRRLSGLWNRGNSSRVYPSASVYVSDIGRYTRKSHERALAGAANKERAFRIGERERARRQSSPPPPQAPSGLKAIPGDRLIRLRKRLSTKLWSLTKGATYRVQLRAGRNGVWGPPGEVEVTFAP